MYVINPYLAFGGNCREAMNFYKDCLGAELIMQEMGETPMAAELGAENQKKIMHASLSKDGAVLFMASDMMANEAVLQGNTISISLNCSSEEELRTTFAKLSEGGKVTQPVEEAFWGAIFGMFVDKYGFNWLMNFDKSRHPQA